MFTVPLIVNKTTGVKFGKTEGGAVWLDPNQTSIFKFYQFWLNVDDAGVEDYLKVYTELSKEEIDAVMNEFKSKPHERHAQKVLAREVTKIVHGDEAVTKITKVTDALFGATNFLDLDQSERELLATEFSVHPATDDLYQMLVDAQLASSKSEARNFHASGAISVNGEKVQPDQEISWQSGLNLVKRGKNKFALVKY